MGPWLRGVGMCFSEDLYIFFHLYGSTLIFFFNNIIEALEKVEYSFNLGHHVDN